MLTYNIGSKNPAFISLIFLMANSYRLTSLATVLNIRNLHQTLDVSDNSSVDNKNSSLGAIIIRTLVLYSASTKQHQQKTSNQWSLLPELSIGFAGCAGSGSLISTTTTSDVKKVFATDEAFSRQHLTTCTTISKRVMTGPRATTMFRPNAIQVKQVPTNIQNKSQRKHRLFSC